MCVQVQAVTLQSPEFFQQWDLQWSPANPPVLKLRVRAAAAAAAARVQLRPGWKRHTGKLASLSHTLWVCKPAAYSTLFLSCLIFFVVVVVECQVHAKPGCLNETKCLPQMLDGLHRTIFRFLHGNCLEKNRYFHTILGRWLDELPVYYRLTNKTNSVT